jgi:hypothetical protein
VSRSLQDRIERAEQQLASMESGRKLVVVGDAGVESTWETASLDWRRSLLDVLIEQIVVHPTLRGSHRFNPDRFELVWRM